MEKESVTGGAGKEVSVVSQTTRPPRVNLDGSPLSLALSDPLENPVSRRSFPLVLS